MALSGRENWQKVQLAVRAFLWGSWSEYQALPVQCLRDDSSGSTGAACRRRPHKYCGRANCSIRESAGINHPSSPVFDSREPLRYRQTPSRPSTHRTAALYPLRVPMTIEQAPPLEVILCGNDIENGRHPRYSKVSLPLGTLQLRLPWPRPISTSTYELAEVANTVNRLRQSKRIEYLIPDEVLAHLKRTIQTSAGHKRKYNELLDRTKREARRVKRSLECQAGHYCPDADETWWALNVLGTQCVLAMLLVTRFHIRYSFDRIIGISTTKIRTEMRLA